MPFARIVEAAWKFIGGATVTGGLTTDNLTVTGTTTGVSSTPADGGVTTAKLATDAVQGVKIDKANTFRSYVVQGLDLSASSATQIAMSGAKTGDRIISCLKVVGETGAMSEGSGAFEATASTNGGFKQTSLTDESGSNFVLLVLARS